jgi:MoaA/NifB/PqqE/SkfB family radical SAM enzyme
MRNVQRLEFVWLEITGRCNLRCTHCYADSGPGLPLDEGMAAADWFAALEESAALGCRRVQFIGGEPTLHPELPALIGHARALGFEEVCVYTNGTRFTPAVKDALREHAVDLAFSVYAATPAVHDGITLRAGSFDRTIAAIRWAVESGLRVRAGVIAMPENAAHTAAARQLLGELGVADVHIDPVRKLGRGLTYGAPASELGELCGRCGNGKLCVSASGEIFPCVFSRFAPLGHFRAAGLAGALGGAPLEQFRSDLVETFARKYPHYRHDIARLASTCSPEEDPGPCNPERDPGKCSPEKDPGKCSPEIDPGPCRPEKPAIYSLERAASSPSAAPLFFLPRR